MLILRKKKQITERMKTIKIDFKNFFEGFNKENNYFTDTLRETYDVIISNEPDFMFCSVYAPAKNVRDVSSKGDFIRKISPRLYVLLRKLYIKLYCKQEEIVQPEGDFIKILYASERVIPDMSKFDYAFSTHKDEIIGNKNHTRIPFHIVCNYPLHKYCELPYDRKIDFEKIKKEKTKFCNFLYSQDVNDRNDFFKQLSKYKKIDSPGRCMNNMEQVSNDDPRSSRVSKDWVKTKLDFLKQYKFTIAFENEMNDGWTTEKLTHPLLANSIPIYVGNKKVHEDFNTKSFINYNDFKDVDKFIKYIKKVDSNDILWRYHLEQPFFNTEEQHYFASHKRIKDKLNEIIENHIK